MSSKHNDKKQTAGGTYAKVTPSAETVQRILSIAGQLNIPNLVGPSSLHTTVVYSRVVCDEIANINVHFPMHAAGKSFRIFETESGERALVLELNSIRLHSLHDYCRIAYHATHDYPSYTPHITLSYDYPDIDLPSSDMLQYFKDLEFDQFVVEPLNFEWTE
jgi:2'-5' RNA ligase